MRDVSAVRALSSSAAICFGATVRRLSCRQLDRERHSVEAMANMRNHRRIGVVETEGGCGLLGAGDEELDRLVPHQAAGIDRLRRIRHPERRALAMRSHLAGEAAPGWWREP